MVLIEIFEHICVSQSIASLWSHHNDRPSRIRESRFIQTNIPAILRRPLFPFVLNQVHVDKGSVWCREFLWGERGHDQAMAENSYHIWLRRGQRDFTNMELSSETSAIIFWTPPASEPQDIIELLMRYLMAWIVLLLCVLYCFDSVVTHSNKTRSTHFRQTRDLPNGRQSP